MIRIKLSDLLGKHKMSQKALSNLTNIRPATISKMYYEESKRLDIAGKCTSRLELVEA